VYIKGFPEETVVRELRICERVDEARIMEILFSIVDLVLLVKTQFQREQ
jgi:hypothetical protein